jgi:hypothetical protein
MGPHPDEVKIIAPAGSVILFNAADLWHSGTFNYTPAARLALTAHFDPGAGDLPSAEVATGETALLLWADLPTAAGGRFRGGRAAG